MSGKTKRLLWDELMAREELGFYQTCLSCDWIGRGMDELLDRCPICGAETDPHGGFMAGGCMAWLVDDEGYIGSPISPIYTWKLQEADLPSIVDLLEHWKNRSLNARKQSG